MSAKPMLFSGPMVRAILEGRKTQTRRIVKPQPDPMVNDFCFAADGSHEVKFLENMPGGRIAIAHGEWIRPKFVTGDEIWVRETFGFSSYSSKYPQPCPEAIGSGWAIHYRADGKPDVLFHPDGPWKPSIFMPRWASRITLKVTDVRVQRLRDISEEDATAEGVEIDMWDMAIVSRNYAITDREASGSWFQSWRPDCGPIYVDEDEVARASYRSLWESINGKGSWDANPWVWAYTFEVKR